MTGTKIDKETANDIDLLQYAKENIGAGVKKTPHRDIISQVKSGCTQRIAFSVDGFATREFAGKIERINPSAEVGSRSISIFVSIPNNDGSLKGGMFANGVLNTAAGTEVDVIPAAAVIEEGGQTFVYVLKDGKVERRTLTLGARSKERGLVEVREGLEKDVSVITAKAQGLKPGAPAIVAPAKKR